jgi:hypothetical protein
MPQNNPQKCDHPPLGVPEVLRATFETVMAKVGQTRKAGPLLTLPLGLVKNHGLGIQLSLDSLGYYW